MSADSLKKKKKKREKVKIELWFWSLLCTRTLTYFEQSLLTKQQRKQAGRAKGSCMELLSRAFRAARPEHEEKNPTGNLAAIQKFKAFERTLW